MIKRIIATLLACILCIGLSLPAMAEGGEIVIEDAVALMNDVRWGRSTRDRLYAIDRLKAVMGGRVAVVGDEVRMMTWESRFVAPRPAAPEDVEWPPDGEEIDGTPVPFPEGEEL